MRKGFLFISMVLIASLSIPLSQAYSDSLMHVGIGRGIRAGTTPDIDIGRGPGVNYYGYGARYSLGYDRRESLMHVGIGRGIRAATTPEIDIGRGPNYSPFGSSCSRYRKTPERVSAETDVSREINIGRRCSSCGHSRFQSAGTYRYVGSSGGCSAERIIYR